jgi:hypothetical protein
MSDDNKSADTANVTPAPKPKATKSKTAKPVVPEAPVEKTAAKVKAPKKTAPETDVAAAVKDLKFSDGTLASALPYAEYKAYLGLIGADVTRESEAAAAGLAACMVVEWLRRGLIDRASAERELERLRGELPAAVIEPEAVRPNDALVVAGANALALQIAKLSDKLKPRDETLGFLKPNSFGFDVTVNGDKGFGVIIDGSRDMADYLSRFKQHELFVKTLEEYDGVMGALTHLFETFGVYVPKTSRIDRATGKTSTDYVAFRAGCQYEQDLINKGVVALIGHFEEMQRQRDEAVRQRDAAHHEQVRLETRIEQMEAPRIQPVVEGEVMFVLHDAKRGFYVGLSDGADYGRALPTQYKPVLRESALVFRDRESARDVLEALRMNRGRLVLRINPDCFSIERA